MTETQPVSDLSGEGEGPPGGGPKVEDRIVKAVERVAGVADRYGVPATTFAVGAVALLWPTTGTRAEILPWLGCALIAVAVGIYIWQTARSTVKVHTTPPSIPTEVVELLEWMRGQLTEQDKWCRKLIENHFEVTPKGDS